MKLIETLKTAHLSGSLPIKGMAVLLTTSVGPLVIDLITEECPLACKNFLKLCKSGYYNGAIFWNVQANYIAQTGDPTGTGRVANRSSACLDAGEEDRRSLLPSSGFLDEINKDRKINRVGLVCMAHGNDATNANRSQFFITLRGQDLGHLEGKHTVFGEVMEGHGVLEKINKLYTLMRKVGHLKIFELSVPTSLTTLTRTYRVSAYCENTPMQCMCPQRSPSRKELHIKAIMSCLRKKKE